MPSATVSGLGTLTGSPGGYTCTLIMGTTTSQPTTSAAPANAIVVGASNTAPIVLTLSAPLAVGPGYTAAVVSGVGGNTAANGSFSFSLAGRFMTLLGSDGTSSPPYTSDGTVSVSGTSSTQPASAGRGIVSLSPITVTTPDLSCVRTAMIMRWNELNDQPFVPNVATNTVDVWSVQIVNAFRSAGGQVPAGFPSVR
jgi:hypothetical protein